MADLDSDELKTCSKCQRQFPKGDFPMTTARGRILIRSWCAECLKGYYGQRRRKNKVAS